MPSIEATRRWNKKNRASTKQAQRDWLRKLKANLVCIRCNENHPACLDFHHRDPAIKDSNIGSLVASRISRSRILSEIEKCDVLCANCHRKEHWNEYH